MTPIPRALGVIPARLGSTRFPAKPLAELCGRPMIEHTYRAAAAAQLLSKVLVASDSGRVLDAIGAIGGHGIRTGECATGTDRVVEALHRLPAQELAGYDVVVNIQGDEPGVDPQHIDQCITALRDDPTCVMSTLATPLRDAQEAQSRDVVKCVIDVHSNALYFSRALIPHSKSGEFSPHPNSPYLRHVGLYAFRTEFLLAFPSMPPSPLEEAEDLEQLRVLSAGHKIKIVRVDSTLPGVDTIADLQTLTTQWPSRRRVEGSNQ